MPTSFTKVMVMAQSQSESKAKEHVKAIRLELEDAKPPGMLDRSLVLCVSYAKHIFGRSVLQDSLIMTKGCRRNSTRTKTTS